MPKTPQKEEGVDTTKMLVRVDGRIHREMKKLAVDSNWTLAECAEQAMLEYIARHKYQLPKPAKRSVLSNQSSLLIQDNFGEFSD